jgi:hypothetical protein
MSIRPGTHRFDLDSTGKKPRNTGSYDRRPASHGYEAAEPHASSSDAHVTTGSSSSTDQASQIPNPEAPAQGPLERFLRELRTEDARLDELPYGIGSPWVPGSPDARLDPGESVSLDSAAPAASGTRLLGLDTTVRAGEALSAPVSNDADRRGSYADAAQHRHTPVDHASESHTNINDTGSRATDPTAGAARIALVNVRGQRVTEPGRPAAAPSPPSEPYPPHNALPSAQTDPAATVRLPEERQVGHYRPSPPRVGLDQVLARKTLVLWYEAVAIVDRTCAELIQQDGGELPPPDFPGIRIGADGTVAVQAGEGGEPSVRRLGRILQALVPAQFTPHRLSLFISQWVAAPETKSLRDLAGELTYFARPNPEMLIRAVYERCLAQPAPAPVSAVTTRSPNEVPVRIGKQTDLDAGGKSPLWKALTVAAIVASLAGGIFVWVFPGWPLDSVSDGGDVSELQNESAPAAGGVAVPATAATTSVRGTPSQPTTGVPSPAPPQASPRAGALSPGPGPSATASARSGNPEPAATGSPFSGPAASPPVGSGSAAAGGPATVPGAMPRSTDGGQSPNPPSARASNSGATPPPTERLEDFTSGRLEITASGGSTGVPVYSTADPEVQPPRLRSAEIPEWLIAGFSVRTNAIDLLVSERGTVENVRMIGNPQRLPDVMLLSRAKALEFDPARRDGRPVKYRLTITWKVTP